MLIYRKYLLAIHYIEPSHVQKNDDTYFEVIKTRYYMYSETQ